MQCATQQVTTRITELDYLTIQNILLLFDRKDGFA